jgi:hypothetical protein
MDYRHRLSERHRADVHPHTAAPPGVHPAFGRARRSGARRRAQQPVGRHCDGEQPLGTVFRRGRGLWSVLCPLPTFCAKVRIHVHCQWPPALHTISICSPVRNSSCYQGEGRVHVCWGYVRDISDALIPEVDIETDD